MESDIQTQLPEGSPLLAYGQSGTRQTKTVLAVIAAGVVLLGILCLIWALGFWNIALPEQTIALAAIHGRTELPESAPELWRQAAEQTSHPLLLGLARKTDEWVPFVLGVRSDPIVGEFQAHEWLLLLQSTEAIEQTRLHSFRSLLNLVRSLKSHRAFLSLSLEAPTSSSTPLVIRGPIDGTTWTTDAPLTIPAHTFSAADLNLNIAALPDSWSTLVSTLSPHPLPIPLEEEPLALSWTMSQGTREQLELEFEAPPSTSTRQALEAAAGIFGVRPYSLPDQTLAQELTPPLAESQTLSTSTMSALDEDKKRVTLGGPIAFPVDLGSPCAPEPFALRLSQTSMNAVLEQLGLSLRFPGKSFIVASKEGKAIFCIN